MVYIGIHMAQREQMFCQGHYMQEMLENRWRLISIQLHHLNGIASLKTICVYETETVNTS